MKILHLLENYLPLTESWIYPQIIGDGTWESTVASVFYSNTNLYPFNDVYAFAKDWPFFSYGRLRSILYRFPKVWINWIKHKISNYSFDLLHCHFGDFGYHAISLKKHLKIPMLTMFYGYDGTRLPSVKPIWKERYTKLFKIGDKFLVEGNHMKQILLNLGCKEEKITIFHLGVDLEKIHFQVKRFYPGDTLKILAAAAFREKKGLVYAIEAFAYAKKEYPNMKLTIIGDSPDKQKDEKRRILTIIEKHNLFNSISLLGFQPHSRYIEELQRNHLFISPSVTARDGDMEGGSPVTITEASAAGLPIISTFHCDIPEVVLHGKTGLLAEEKDIMTLKENILFFVKNYEAITEFGRNGREHIEKEYNLNKQIKKLGDIYKSLIKG